MTEENKLHLFNTLKREKRPFKPLEEGKVTFYSCGQTIYDDLHVGNARAYVVWDTLRRYLEYENKHTDTESYIVRHVQNITDVGHLTDDGDQGEDKIEKRAKEMDIEPMELVEKQLARYFNDVSDLNIGRGDSERYGAMQKNDPSKETGRQDIVPRATGHINEMIEYVQKIIDNGYAYEVDGNVYFDLEKFSRDYDYGKLAKKDIDELKEEAESRVEEDSKKKNQYDFALWLNAEGTGHLMQWTAKFDLGEGEEEEWKKSRGYPGWHLECSVMSQKYLGEKFDIHAGGKDHIFPHHPNERAQCLAATDEEQAEFWLHNEFIQVEGEKMSKSEGNFYTVRQLIKGKGEEIPNEGFSGDAVRLYLISSHYRTETDFSIEGLEKAEKELNKLRRAWHRSEKTSGDKLKSRTRDVREVFEEAMDDDLNTAKAKQILVGFADEMLKELEKGNNIHIRARTTLNELTTVLGIGLFRDTGKKEVEMADYLKNLRSDLREKELYEFSDEIREKMPEFGWKLEDREDRTVLFRIE